MQHPYQTLAYVMRLSFKDAHGLEALSDCYQRVRVLAPELRFVQQEVWGDGDPLNDFVSTPAEVVHQARINGRYTLVSALKRPASQGDEIELYSTRRIHHAFKDDTRFFWEYSPVSPTEHARVTIDFPLGRNIEQLAVGATAGSRTPHVERPGMKRLVTSVQFPTLNSLYRMSWSW